MINSKSTTKLPAKFESVVVSSMLLLSLALVGTTANAASQCKGLETNACTTNSACTWVEGYQRKDGRQVNSFCRAKAKPKAPKKATSKS